MKCPACQHALDIAITCEACGQSYESAKLEQLAHTEYLLTWLDERATFFGPKRHAQLKHEAWGQLERDRDALGLIPPREPAEVARELAQVQATFNQARRWRQTGAVTEDTAFALRKHLAAQRGALQRELAGRRAEVQTPSQLEVYAFARRNLRAWARDVPLHIADAIALERYLRAERDALLKQLRYKLGLTQAALEHFQRWTDAPARCPHPPEELCAYLMQRSNALRAQLADEGGQIPEPSTQQLLDYADAELPRWTKEVPLAPAEATALRDHLSQQRRALLLPLARQRGLVLAALAEAGDWSQAAGIAGSPISHYLGQQADVLGDQLEERSLALKPPSDLQVIDYALQSVPLWKRETHLSRAEVEGLREVLESRRRALLQPVPPVAVPIVEVVPPAPPSTPPPSDPSFTFEPGNWWDRFWALVASGAFLKGLLYLGAFMIVVAVGVLAVRYWNQYPSLVQLAFIAAVPLAFYANGFVLRKWFAAPVAGGVFTGIGALLVAVDFMVVYQYGGVAGSLDGRLYWLAASVFCTLSYALTAWRLPIEFFGYVTLAGACSTVLAFTSLLRPSLEWHSVALTAFGVLTVEVSARLYRARARWQELAQAAWRLPQLLIPICQGLALLVPGDAWLGQTATFLLAALGYARLAVDDRSGGKWSAVLAQASVWSTVPAVGLALQAAALPPQWYAAVAAALAPVYAVASRTLIRWTTSHGIVEEGLETRAFRLGLEWAAYGCILLAVLGGVAATVLGYVPQGVAGMTLAALDLALLAYLYRRPLFAFAAAQLFIVPFSVTIYDGLHQHSIAQWGAWLMAGWTGLALAYLGLAASLRRAESYAACLNGWAMVLTPLAFIGLAGNWLATAEDWTAGPTLAALGGAILVYAVCAVLHDSGRHPALSHYANALPERVQAAIFLWPLGFLLPLWLALAWWSSGNDSVWLGALLAGLGLAYVGLGQLLGRRNTAYRLPPHFCAYGLGMVGVVTASGEPWALLTSLLLGVGILTSVALVYRRPQETALASLLFVWPFHIGLELSPLPQQIYPLAYVLLATLGYIPLGRILEKVGHRHAFAEYVIGYTLSALALTAVLVPRFAAGAGGITWVGVAVPLIVAGSQAWSAYRFSRPELAWTATLSFAIAYGQSLALLGVPAAFHAAAWVSLALAHMVAERVLGQARNAPVHARSDHEHAWQRAFQWPLKLGVVGLCALGLSLTVKPTTLALMGETLPRGSYPPLLLAQGLAVGLTILAARAYRSHWPLYLEPWLASVPLTLGVAAYGARVNDHGVASYSLIWSALALAHLGVAAIVDRMPVRYAQGLYLGGYGLGVLALYSALQDEAALFWTLGLALAAAGGSAWLVHTGRHRSWDELISSLFAPQPSTERLVARGAFVWFSAWTFPIWCVLLLRRLGVTDRYQWLGLAFGALSLLALARWLSRSSRSYRWPLHSAAQFYTAAGLVISSPLTLRLIRGYLDGRIHLPSDTPDAPAIVLQTALGVVFYAGSAWVLRRRIFAHVAAWLSIVPYTLAWMVRGPTLDPAAFAGLWIAWAALLLALGLLLDHEPMRYAHGPYLAGYLLGMLALLWSAQSLLSSVYTMSAAIVLAAVSQLLVHVGLHRTFEDFLRHFWRVPGTVAERMARDIFLFFAVYSFPVWLTALLLYHDVPLAWRGVTLAVVAPIYIACGMALRRVRETYTWPFYSAGYALTVIGAMLTIEDQGLAICTLSLNVVVYVVSAYIFRQSFWLYLSNALVPVVALLTLDYHQILLTPWVAGAFMALSFLYFITGLHFDRELGSTSRRVAPFALPFYAPAYLLSALALALASANGEKPLVVAMYVAGVGLYAVSAWALREPLFLYPAVWLTTVPYYVLLTVTPLPARWHGLAWLPVIVACIAAGRYAFVSRGTDLRDRGTFVAALMRPAAPFYLLAYGLTPLMVAVSIQNQLALACAFAASAMVYLGSAALFRHPAWLYPGLAALHLSLATGAWLVLSGAAAHAMAPPFLALTWAMALVGLVFSRSASANSAGVATGRATSDWAFVNRLTAPGWASPFFQFVAFDLILWQMVALGGLDTTILLGLGHAALVSLFATLWVDTVLAYAALGYVLLTLASALRWLALPVPVAMAWTGGAGFAAYLLAWSVERLAPKIQLRTLALGVWPKPLTYTAIGLATLAIAGTASTVDTYPSATAAALATAGALALTIAYRNQLPRLGYAGAAMLLLAWALVLTASEVEQPQLYAIPAGIYLVSIGVLERRQAPRPFALYIEAFGLTVMLLTSFIQSLDAAGFPYFLLLLVQALLVILWGAARRVKIPFLLGIGASALNVAAQITVLLLATRRSTAQGDPLLIAVLITLGVGLILCLLAVAVERQRARLIALTHEWRVVLDSWD